MENDSPFEALATAEDRLWQALGRASKDRRSPWHTPALATIGLDGQPRARILVLREAVRATRLLRLHSDRRAAKVAELAADPRASLLLYDAGARLQLRIEGLARVEAEGPAASRAWADASLFARRCYTAPVGPGSVAEAPTSGLPPEYESREPTAQESEAGRPNFSVILFEARCLEFLHLAVTGHRRGAFQWDAATASWHGCWMVP